MLLLPAADESAKAELAENVLLHFPGGTLLSQHVFSAPYYLVAVTRLSHFAPWWTKEAAKAFPGRNVLQCGPKGGYLDDACIRLVPQFVYELIKFLEDGEDVEASAYHKTLSDGFTQQQLDDAVADFLFNVHADPSDLCEESLRVATAAKAAIAATGSVRSVLALLDNLDLNYEIDDMVETLNSFAATAL